MTDNPNQPAEPVPAPADGPIRRLGRELVSPNSYGSVLLLIIFTYLFSIAVTATWASSLVVTVQIATIWVVLRVSEAHRGVRRVAGVLVLISVLGAIVNLVAGRAAWLHGGIALISALLYVLAPFAIARHLLFRRQIDQQTVLGALDIYLLIGMMLAFVYHFLGIVQTDPFFGANGSGTFQQDLFFSFTTLTTTGYGNLVPADNPGQTAAVLEMLVGQLFLVTAVAKVISAYRPPRRPVSDGEEGADG